MRSKSARPCGATVRGKVSWERLCFICSVWRMSWRNRGLTSSRLTHNVKQQSYSPTSLTHTWIPHPSPLLWFLAGSFGYEESPRYSECPAGSQRLCLQPHQAGPGSRNASATLEHCHSAFTGGHENVPQPPAGSFMSEWHTDSHLLFHLSHVSVPK